MSKLFEIGNDLLALQDLLDEANGDVSDPQVETAIDSWFAELAANEGEKLDGYIGLIRTLEGEAVVARAEADQFAAKAQSRTKRVDWLKQRLKDHLTRTGRLKVHSAKGRIVSVVNNGGLCPLLMDDVTAEQVDAVYTRVRVEIDRECVRTLLEAGREVPFARLGPRGTSLRIR